MISEWKNHKGHRYFFCNYANLSLADLQKEIDAVDQLIGQQAPKSLLILTDLSGLMGSPQVVGMFKKSTSYTKPFLKRSAVIGVGFTGPKKVLFDIVMRFSGQNSVSFDDVEKAKDWLVNG